MKIVFITDQIYLHGGIEKTLAEKVNYFCDVLAYDVTIVTTGQQQRPPCYPLSAKVKLIDLDINYITGTSYFNIANFKKAYPHFKRQHSILKKLGPDVIIMCNYAFDFYWVPFIQKSAAKLKEYHSSRFYQNLDRKNNRSLLKKILYQLTDWVEAKYDRLVILNKNEAQFYGNNTVVIPNSIPVLPTLKAPLKSKHVIAAGRIAPVKGFEKLIDAWAIVASKHPDWSLHIYGDNYLGTQQQLQKVVIQKDLESQVIFKGSTSNILETMLDYSIFAMSSITECFPMVLLEALSVGLPIVSFNCPTGPRNIITDGKDGILAYDQNINDLANKLIILIDDQELRKQMGNAGKLNSNQFSNPVVMQKWQYLFNSLKK